VESTFQSCPCVTHGGLRFPFRWGRDGSRADLTPVLSAPGQGCFWICNSSYVQAILTLLSSEIVSDRLSARSTVGLLRKFSFCAGARARWPDHAGDGCGRCGGVGAGSAAAGGADDFDGGRAGIAYRRGLACAETRPGERAASDAGKRGIELPANYAPTQLLGRELANMGTRMNERGRVRFGRSREGEHDDLVMACALETANRDRL
jgi:hypothetical protein